jgi:hypothetical protein
MSCARIAREVMDFFRFGDLDARSAPHLDHLATCVACRDEVGLDRELVLQLQRALAARVDGHAASPGAWIEIRRRALQPEPSWIGRFLPALRVAPIGATVVVVLALIAAPHLDPLRVRPDLPSGEPTWRILEAVEAMDAEDAEAERWWLRYVTVQAPHTGAVATFEPWERAPSPSLGGHSR